MFDIKRSVGPVQIQDFHTKKWQKHSSIILKESN